MFVLGALVWKKAAKPLIPSESYRDGTVKLEEYAKENERAGAYAAVREHIKKTVQGPKVAIVHFGDCWHEVEQRTFAIRGEIRLESPRGEQTQLHYFCTLRGSTSTKWTIIDLALEDGHLPQELR
jgi:hypothetical protein